MIQKTRGSISSFETLFCNVNKEGSTIFELMEVDCKIVKKEIYFQNILF